MVPHFSVVQREKGQRADPNLLSVCVTVNMWRLVIKTLQILCYVFKIVNSSSLMLNWSFMLSLFLLFSSPLSLSSLRYQIWLFNPCSPLHIIFYSLLRTRKLVLFPLMWLMLKLALLISYQIQMYTCILSFNGTIL